MSYIPIDQALRNIMSARYGQEVRTSIHDAIFQIDDIANIKFGTDVTSPTSPSGDYSIDVLYINTDTYDIWKLVNATTWQKVGNIKGAQGSSVVSVTEKSHVGRVHTYTMTFSDGTTCDFTVSDGQTGSGSGDMLKSVYDTDDDGIVDKSELAEKLSDGTNTVTITDISNMNTAISGKLSNTEKDPTISGSLANQIEEVKKIANNPNLLDNPFFTVNSRGQSSYTYNYPNIYSVDRWYMYQTTIEKLSSGVRYTAHVDYGEFSQKLNNMSELLGQTVTISAKFKSISGGRFRVALYGNDSYISSSQLTDTDGIVKFTYTIPTNITHNLSVSIQGDTNGASAIIECAKLELGSVSTLANDIAPNYAEELLKCQGSTADSSDIYANGKTIYTKGISANDGTKSIQVLLDEIITKDNFPHDYDTRIITLGNTQGQFICNAMNFNGWVVGSGQATPTNEGLGNTISFSRYIWSTSLASTTIVYR